MRDNRFVTVQAEMPRNIDKPTVNTVTRGRKAAILLEEPTCAEDSSFFKWRKIFRFHAFKTDAAGSSLRVISSALRKNNPSNNPMNVSKPSKALSAVLTALCIASPIQAAVTTLGSHTKTTDGSETFTNVFGGGVQLFNHTSGNVYVVIQTTFSNPVNPGTLDTSESYGGFAHSDNDLFGQLWQSSAIGVAYYGERTTGVTIPVGSPITLVIKYELNGVGLDGDTVKFWVNPTLGTGVEGAPNDADPSRTWAPTSISSDDMRFRRGNSSDNQIQFGNVTIYDGGSSPFAAIPEPSAALLGGLGLLGFVRRRNR